MCHQNTESQIFQVRARGGVPPRRTGAHHASITPYGPYETGEGGPVYLAIQNAREWTRFCGDVLRCPELADDDRFRANRDRVEHRAALDQLIADVFNELSATDVMARLDQAGAIPGAIERAEDAVDAVARVAVDPLDPPVPQPSDDELELERDMEYFVEPEEALGPRVGEPGE